MVEVIRLGMGFLFVAAGVSKVLRRSSVRLVVARYRLLPSVVVGPAAVSLGPFEVLVGLGLGVSPWFPAAARPGLFGAAVLLVTFSLAISSALARGISVPCGCGVLLGDHAITPAILLRNLLLLLTLYLVR